MMSYRTKSGCENSQMRGYEHSNYGGNHFIMKDGAHNTPGGLYNRISSVLEVSVPTSKSGHLKHDLDFNYKDEGENTIRHLSDASEACPGARGDGRWVKTGGKRYRCFYSKTDAGQLQNLYNNRHTNTDLKNMHDTLSEQFCSVRDNITKNPGGSSCWDRKHATDLAREYCGVGNRITSDMCDIGKTKHIGRQVYDDLAKAYCKTSQGENDEWCACRNTMRDSGAWCKNNPTKPGCKDVMAHYNAILATVPEKFRGKFPIERIKCMKNVCTDGSKWKPVSLDDQCRNNIQICNMEFDLKSSDIGTLNAKCEQTIKNEQKVAADSAAAAKAAADKAASDKAILERLKQLEEKNKKLSETPSPSPSSSPSSRESPKTPSPSTTDNNNSKKRLLGGGGVLFFSCCLFLLIVLMMGGETNNNNYNNNSF